MTFDATEIASLAAPIEFITFQNGTERWRYTNSNIVEQIGADVFTPLAYTRTEPSFSKEESGGELRLIVPSTIPLIALYENQPSSQATTITIRRRHINDVDQEAAIYWQGILGSVTQTGQVSTIQCMPITGLKAQIPRYTYSGLCNWFLFQDRCGLLKENFRHISTVLSVQTDNTFTVDGLRAQAAAIDASHTSALSSAELDAYWLGGYAENGDGEKRSIFGVDVDGVPDRIRIINPFRSLEVSDTITVYAGCSRTRDICNRKFENHLNHGGFPDIPDVNVFDTELPSGSTEPTRKAWFGN